VLARPLDYVTRVGIVYESYGHEKGTRKLIPHFLGFLHPPFGFMCLMGALRKVFAREITSFSLLTGFRE
jgi:hypothetical protein